MNPSSNHKLPVPCGAHLVARALQRHGVETDRFGSGVGTMDGLV